MSAMGCVVLASIKARIESGERAEDVIPFSLDCPDHEDYIELLYYAKQVITDERRLSEIEQILARELENVSR